MRSLPVDLSSGECSLGSRGAGRWGGWSLDALSCGDCAECPYKDVGAWWRLTTSACLISRFFFLMAFVGRGLGIYFLLEVCSLPHELENRTVVLTLTDASGSEYCSGAHLLARLGGWKWCRISKRRGGWDPGTRTAFSVVCAGKKHLSLVYL